MAENSNQDLAGLFAKIAIISGKIGGVDADKKHGQGYKYHSADAILGALNTLMAEHGLVVIPTAPSVRTENDSWLISYQFILCDAETGATFAADWTSSAPIKFGQNLDDKAIGKAHTYAHKYFLMKLFMISSVDTDDLDANDNSQAKTASKEEKESAPPQVPQESIDDVDRIIGTTPPTLTDEQAFIFNLMQIILPMCKHENHARNAIEKAIEDSAIGKGDSLDKAAGVMLLRRMKSQWGLTEDESRGVLPEALGMTMKEYLTANPRDYAGIWATLTARYAEMPE